MAGLNWSDGCTRSWRSSWWLDLLCNIIGRFWASKSCAVGISVLILCSLKVFGIRLSFALWLAIALWRGFETCLACAGNGTYNLWNSMFCLICLWRSSLSSKQCFRANVFNSSPCLFSSARRWSRAARWRFIWVHAADWPPEFKYWDRVNPGGWLLCAVVCDEGASIAALDIAMIWCGSYLTRIKIVLIAFEFLDPKKITSRW